MKLSIAVPSKNRHKHLAEALHDLNENISIQKEVIVAYSNDDIETRDLLKTVDWITGVEDGNRGAIAAYNSAMKLTTGEYISYITDDIRIVKDSYEIAIDYLDEHNEYAGVLFYHRDGAAPYHIHNLGDHIGGLKYEKGNRPFFMWGLLRNSMMQKIGYWDERYKNYFANPDMCVSIFENGFDIIALPECKIIHTPIVDDLITSNYKTFEIDKRAFINKWGGILK